MTPPVVIVIHLPNYVERFRVGGHGCAISLEVSGKYRIWFGGSCISGEMDDIQECRVLLHQYLVCQLSSEKSGYVERFEKVQDTLDKLKDDPFYLALFMQPE